jgi:hypothetical protein
MVVGNPWLIKLRKSPFITCELKETVIQSYSFRSYPGTDPAFGNCSGRENYFMLLLYLIWIVREKTWFYIKKKLFL